MATPDKSLIALKVVNGEKVWEYKTEGAAALRGLMVGENEKFIFVIKNLISLNPKKWKTT